MPAAMPRPFRVPEPLYHEALTAARAKGTTLTAVVVAALQRLVEQHAIDMAPRCAACGMLADHGLHEGPAGRGAHPFMPTADAWTAWRAEQGLPPITR